MSIGGMSGADCTSGTLSTVILASGMSGTSKPPERPPDKPPETPKPQNPKTP